jgi:hypothetical protein
MLGPGERLAPFLVRDRLPVVPHGLHFQTDHCLSLSPPEGTSGTAYPNPRWTRPIGDHILPAWPMMPN